MSDIKKRLYDYLHSRQAAGFGDLTLFNELYEHISEQAEEIQRLSDAQRWIPVSERPPEDGDNVVATMNFEWYGCCKYQGFFPWVKPNWIDNSDNQTSDPVTHWIMLPPKDTGA